MAEREGLACLWHAIPKVPVLPSEALAETSVALLNSGGEGGIRTLGARRLNGFRDRPIQPLSHLSARKPAVEGITWTGLEQPRACRPRRRL